MCGLQGWIRLQQKGTLRNLRLMRRDRLQGHRFWQTLHTLLYTIRHLSA
jgi:hypothetical protein